MTIELGNIYYFIYIGIFILVTLLIGLIFKNKSEKAKYSVILIIAFLNFILHFIKLFIVKKYHDDLPYSISKITFENICAVSTMIFPFLVISKNKYLRDYMFYIGILSGLGALLFPEEVLHREAFSVNTFRFYFCHASLFLVPFYLVMFNFHKLSLKRIWALPVNFMLVQTIILANEIILSEIGFTDFRSTDFLNYNYRNHSWIFGPSGLGNAQKWLVDWMVPKPFKTIMVGEYKGESKYTPLLWMIIPVWVYLSLAYLGIYFVFAKLLHKKEITN